MARRPPSLAGDFSSCRSTVSRALFWIRRLHLDACVFSNDYCAVTAIACNRCPSAYRPPRLRSRWRRCMACVPTFRAFTTTSASSNRISTFRAVDTRRWSRKNYRRAGAASWKEAAPMAACLLAAPTTISLRSRLSRVQAAAVCSPRFRRLWCLGGYARRVCCERSSSW